MRTALSQPKRQDRLFTAAANRNSIAAAYHAGQERLRKKQIKETSYDTIPERTTDKTAPPTDIENKKDTLEVHDVANRQIFRW